MLFRSKVFLSDVNKSKGRREAEEGRREEEEGRREVEEEKGGDEMVMI